MQTIKLVYKFFFGAWIVARAVWLSKKEEANKKLVLCFIKQLLWDSVFKVIHGIYKVHKVSQGFYSWEGGCGGGLPQPLKGLPMACVSKSLWQPKSNFSPPCGQTGTTDRRRGEGEPAGTLKPVVQARWVSLAPVKAAHLGDGKPWFQTSAALRIPDHRKGFRNKPRR